MANFAVFFGSRARDERDEVSGRGIRFRVAGRDAGSGFQLKNAGFARGIDVVCFGAARGGSRVTGLDSRDSGSLRVVRAPGDASYFAPFGFLLIVLP